MFQQFLAPIVVLCFAVFAIFAITNNNWTLLGFGALLPFGLMMLSRPDWLLVAGIMTMMSQLTIPGLGGLNFQLFHLLLLGFGMITMARLIITKEELPESPSRKFLYVLLGILAIIIYQRGFGVRFLGSGTIGGAIYIQFLAMILFFLSSYAARLSNRQWRIALIGMLCLTLLPLVASLLLILSHGAIYHQYYFLAVDMGIVESFKTYNTGGSTRWSGFGGLSALYLVPFLFFPFRGRYRAYYGLFIGLSLLFAALTGFRSVLMQSLIFIGLALFLKARNKALLVVGVGLAALAVLIPLSLVADKLPFPVQRVLSIVPFMPIDPAVRDMAAGTIDWRFMLWRRWLHEVPQYLLLGKGFAYSESSLIATTRFVFTEYDLIEPSVVLGDYHIGLLSGLTILGIPGMLALAAFWFSDVLRHIHIQRMPWSDSKFKQYHFVFLLLAVTNILYQLFAGSISVLIISPLIYLGLLNVLANARTMPAESVVQSSNTGPRLRPSASRAPGRFNPDRI